MKMHPKHFFDYLLRPLIVVLWEPFSLKKSHFWHWRKVIDPYAINLPTIIVRANQEAKSRKGFFANLIQTNFGWKMTTVIEPINYDGEYQLGFWAGENGKKYPQTCSLVLKGKTAVLRGPDDVEFYAFSHPEKRAIEIKVIDDLPKSDLTKDVTLI